MVDKKTIKKEVVAKPVAKKIITQEAVTKPVAVKKETKETTEKPKYFAAVGRRKTSTARVRLYTQGKKGITVNDKSLEQYFTLKFHQARVTDPFDKLKCEEKFGISIKVNGGGIASQADAIRHGISRALVLLNPYYKKPLKKLGFLTRDPRMRERKKFGLKRARRAPQWSKR